MKKKRVFNTLFFKHKTKIITLIYLKTIIEKDKLFHQIYLDGGVVLGPA